MNNNINMVQDTASDAGKTVLVAGVCRVLMRKGIKVAPFKPKNRALRIAVTADGGEIDRAQTQQPYRCTSDCDAIFNTPESTRGVCRCM